MGEMGWDGMGMGRKGLGCIVFRRRRGAEVRGEMDEGRVEWMDGDLELRLRWNSERWGYMGQHDRVREGVLKIFMRIRMD